MQKRARGLLFRRGDGCVGAVGNRKRTSRFQAASPGGSLTSVSLGSTDKHIAKRWLSKVPSAAAVATVVQRLTIPLQCHPDRGAR